MTRALTPGAVRCAALAVLLGACARNPAPEARAPVATAAPREARPAPSRPTSPPTRALSIADSMVVLVNRERERANLPTLSASDALTRAAQLHAEQMAAADRLAHELPRARYPTLASRLRLVEYTARASGENIAMGFSSAAAAVAVWMTSPGHRANILSSRYTETGVGTARSKSGRAFHAQVFGRRAEPTRAPARRTPARRTSARP